MSDLQNALNEHFKSGGTQKQVDAIVRKILFNQPRIKIVIDTSFGSFLLTDFAANQLGIQLEDACDVVRTDDRLIKIGKSCNYFLRMNTYK